MIIAEAIQAEVMRVIKNSRTVVEGKWFPANGFTMAREVGDCTGKVCNGGANLLRGTSNK